MKRFLILLFAAAIAISLCACASEKEGNVETVIPTDSEISTEPENGHKFDSSGSHFVGNWVNDSGRTAEVAISGNGTDGYNIIARLYDTLDTFNQWEITAQHALTEDGESGLLVDGCEQYLVIGTEGAYEAVSVVENNVDILFLYSPDTDCVIWYYTDSDDDLVTLVRGDETASAPLPVAEMIA